MSTRFGEDAVETLGAWCLDHCEARESLRILDGMCAFGSRLGVLSIQLISISMSKVGCGNGHLLFSLLQDGYAAEGMLGVDYSLSSVQLCQDIAASRAREGLEGADRIQWRSVDILDRDAVAQLGGQFDLILDKGVRASSLSRRSNGSVDASVCLPFVLISDLRCHLPGASRRRAAPPQQSVRAQHQILAQSGWSVLHHVVQLDSRRVGGEVHEARLRCATYLKLGRAPEVKQADTEYDAHSIRSGAALFCAEAEVHVWGSDGSDDMHGGVSKKAAVLAIAINRGCLLHGSLHSLSGIRVDELSSQTPCGCCRRLGRFCDSLITRGVVHT